MSDHAVHAEWEPLESVRVHTPGLELWSGSLAPGANLFEGHVPLDRAAREHERIVDVLRDAGGRDLPPGGTSKPLTPKNAHSRS